MWGSSDNFSRPEIQTKLTVLQNNGMSMSGFRGKYLFILMRFRLQQEKWCGF
jgi:hypothetical protein